MHAPKPGLFGSARKQWSPARTSSGIASTLGATLSCIGSTFPHFFVFSVAAGRRLRENETMIRTSFSATLSAILLAACASDETRVPNPTITQSGSGTATAILNAGVAAEIGELGGAVKILFDPLYDDHYDVFKQLDAPLIEAIVSGAAPYDNVTAVFVSHAHGDHFSARHLARMLGAQPGLQMVAPEQAVEQLREAEDWQEEFEDRVTGITLENGAQAESFAIAGATIEAFRSPHNGWPERHGNVHNITFRVSAQSGAGLVQRVMHVGDASPDREFLTPHTEFLAAKRTSLAIVPFWFLQADEAEALFGTTLNAQTAVGMHVPASEPRGLAGSGWDYFTDVGQSVPVPEVE